ncbi:hypothetical protein [Streptomyces sp. NPDC006307]|uniref:hypothetical protein n=1 Tax=Streptomyces sp. NPDC006307 TaxID=3156748 RepID=UPI0033B80DC4
MPNTTDTLADLETLVAELEATITEQDLAPVQANSNNPTTCLQSVIVICLTQVYC